MRVLVILIAAATLPAGAALAQNLQTAPPAPTVAPGYQDVAVKRMAERKKLAECRKEAGEKKLLPREAVKFLTDCMDK